MKQVFMGGSGVTVGDGSWMYVDAFAVAEATARQYRETMIAEAGTVSNAKVVLSPAVPVGCSRTFTLLVNGVASALVLSVAAGGTEDEDTVTTVAVAAGDLIEWECQDSPAGTSGTPSVRIACEFEATTANRAVWGTSNDLTASIPATAYQPIGVTGQSSWYALEADAAQPWSINATIKSLYIKLLSAPGAGTSRAFTLMLNGVAVGTTVTIADAATTGSATGMSIVIAPLDTLSLRQVESGAPADNAVQFGISYAPTTDGEWNVCGVLTADYTDGYFVGLNGNSSAQSDEGVRVILGDTPGTGMDYWTLTDFTAAVDVAPGGVQTRTVTVRKSGVDSDLAVTITGAQLESSVYGSITVGVNDYLSIRLNKSATAAGITRIKWAFAARESVTVHPQFVLMLAEESDPDTPVLDITYQNIANPGEVLTKVERGRERAVLGEPPRAGAASTKLANYKMSRYDVEHPLPGLSIRLNKFVDGDEYNLWTGPIDVPQHQMTNWRPVVNINAFGRLSRLASRKVDTSLYTNITTGTAIGHILDAAGFPSGANFRDLDSGTVTLNYWWLSQADALSEINKLVATEGVTAEIYEDGFGRLVFRDRNARYTETRSTVAQSTLRSVNTHPKLSAFEYHSGYREVINKATHVRKTRLADASPSVVWSDASTPAYLLTPGESVTIYATSAEPFTGAITPVLDTDYNVGVGSVTVNLDRTSGSRVGITFTEASGTAPASFGYNNTALTAIQLRATSIPQLGYDIVEENHIDASASILQYGIRPWAGEVWPDVEWYVMRDILDGVVAMKQNPRGRIEVMVEASNGDDENLLTAARQIGDRVRVIESELGVDAQCWIERVEHEIQAPQRHVARYECSVIEADITTNPFDDIDNSHFVGPGSLVLTHVTPTRTFVGVGML